MEKKSVFSLTYCDFWKHENKKRTNRRINSRKTLKNEEIMKKMRIFKFWNESGDEKEKEAMSLKKAVMAVQGDYKDKIIGVGLDSSEVGHPPRKFERVFKKALEKGFLTVAHAGEEGPPDYIWEALNLLKVKRIDHGVQCFRDEKLVQKLQDDQIPLTVCPLSNIKLRVFNTLQEHNLKTMLNNGLMVMVNSDDPAYFGGYVNKNLIQSQTALDLSMKEVKTLIINSFKSSFLKESEKTRWIEKL